MSWAMQRLVFTKLRRCSCGVSRACHHSLHDLDCSPAAPGDAEGLDGALRRSSGGEASHQLPAAASRGMQSAPASPSGKRQGALQVATQGFLGAGNKAVSEASTPPPRHIADSPFQQPQVSWLGLHAFLRLIGMSAFTPNLILQSRLEAANASM